MPVDDKLREKKSILQSKTWWGIVLAVSPMLASIIGFDIAAEFNTLTEALITVIGAAVGVYGRITAKKEVTLTGT